MLVAKSGAVPWLIKLLRSSDADCREQSVWCLGNIAGDSPMCRDGVTSSGMLQPLLELLSSPDAKISMMRNATWALSNLCRGKSPAPNWEAIKPAVPVLAKLILSADPETVADALWALSYVTDGDNQKIQAVCDTGALRRLVELLAHAKTSVVTPALRTVGNVLTGSDRQTQLALDSGLLPHLATLLRSPKESIRKEAAWSVSNVTAGTQSQIQLAFDANILPAVLHVMTNGDAKSKKEATWAIANACSGGSASQLHYIIKQGALPPLVKALEQHDARITCVALDALSKLLACDGRVAGFVEEAGGLDIIEDLQNHDNTEVYEKALKIIETYYGEDEDEDAGGEQPVSGAIVPSTQQGLSFNFGAAAPAAVPAAGGFNF